MNELNKLLNKLDLDLVICSNDKIGTSKDYKEYLELKNKAVRMINDFAKIDDSIEEIMETAIDIIEYLEIGSEFTIKTLFASSGRHEYWERLQGKTKEFGLEFARKIESKEITNVVFVKSDKESSHTSDHSIMYKKINTIL